MNETDYGAWVDARRPALLRYAVLVTHGGPDAEDALQDALTAVHERWSRLDADTAEGYVRRSIANAATSAWRRTGRREVALAVVPEPVGVGGDPADRVLDAALAWRLCQELPPDQRAAVVMRYVEDAPFDVIARALGCEVSTARSHVHRALARMRRALASQEVR